jgi:2-octaprenyl-6-methoxyphenol hydroxylase
VWTEKTAEAQRLLALDPAVVASEIEAAMGHVLGTVTLDDKLVGYPLHLQIAREFVSERLALIGDAAHVVHPIAGQGLNLGLKDVAALAETVVDAIRLGLDHGDDDVLARYQAWRRFDTTSMASMTHALNGLFSNDIAPLRALRDLGLELVDRTAPVKSALIRTASGISHNGPRLLSGLPL